MVIWVWVLIVAFWPDPVRAPAMVALVHEPDVDVSAHPRPERVLQSVPVERYVGSAALESTLDSTIESSLMGSDKAPVAAVMPGVQAVQLPAELDAQVHTLMRDRHEVAAVRLVCDTMDVGIIDALHTVRSVATSTT